MLKGILGFLLFLFFLAILIIMLTGSFILKKVRDFRKAMQEAADQQAFNYRTETGRKRQQYGNRSQGYQDAQTIAIKSVKTRKFSTTPMANMLTSLRNVNYAL